MFARLVPGPLVRLFARPYVAGDSIDDGVATARRLLDEAGLLSTLDLLGEGIQDAREVEENEALYRELVDAIVARPWGGESRPSVSIKPSAFTSGPVEAARRPLAALVDYAAERGVAVTIDMEDRRWTDFTLEAAADLFERGRDVGTVLQTRLDRTEADLERIPAGMRLRLVIGIYPEPEDVATTDKRTMKARMVDYAARLLERGCRVEFATHDEACLERFLRDVASRAPDRAEIQMLLGVPREGFVRRMREGAFETILPVRLYVPFAVGWDDATAYLRRRMAESPSLVWLVLRNLLPRRR